MRNPIRNYKLAIKDAENPDSGPESQPLISSQSSTSFGATRSDCLFQNSDTSDGETKLNGERLIFEYPTTSPDSSKMFMRRPFCFPTIRNEHKYDLYTCDECLYDRIPHFTKLSRMFSMDDASSERKNGVNRKSHSSIVTIFAIWNTVIGSSLLTMSWGLGKAGLFPGIALNICIGALCLYTCYIILQINENYGLAGEHTEVSDLCRTLVGKWAEITAKIFSLIVLIGANIVYWVLMSNFLYNFVLFIYEETHVDNATVICPSQILNISATNVTHHPVAFERIWDLYRTVPIFLGLLLFPLLNFKSPTFFTKFNSLGTLSVMYLVVFVAIKSYTWGVNMTDWMVEWELKSTFCALSGMLSLSYFIHNIIISIMRHNENQNNNGRDLSVAFGLVTFTYLFVGGVFYICFPLAKSCIEDNMLNNFAKSDPLSMAARLLLLFQLFTVFPLIAYMLRVDILNILSAFCAHWAPQHFSYVRVMILNLLLVVVCILFACFLPRIGTLIRYTGALSGSVYVFLLPSLLKIASLRKEEKMTPFKLIFYIFVIALGALNLLSQFLITDK